VSSGPDNADQPADIDGPDGNPDEADADEAALDDGSIRDALPDDLNAAGFVGPYMFPNNNRRRVPGVLYIIIGLGCIAGWLALRSSDPVLINQGFAFAGAGLILFGIYAIVSGWNLDVDERDALVAATRTVGFPVGHASAQMGWRGLLSRPTWRILLYSSENPPDKRGLVLVDGVDGEVVEWFVEDNPEDWSELDV
jgi:hypothetical protein